MKAERRRIELGDFLRSTRASLSPEQAGVPGKSRRRAPGLRREEVAELADISPTWYTWLEQGRDIHASHAVLARIADALQLDADKREHLFVLADPDRQDRQPQLAETVSSAFRHVYDSLSAYPAFIRGRRWDMLAWNDLARVFFGDIDILPPSKRNVLRWVFMSPELRRYCVEWEHELRAMLALFRMDYDRYADEGDWFDSLVNELTGTSPEFANWWRQHEINRWRVPVNRYVHPAVGEVALKRIGLSSDDSAGLHLVAFPPVDAASAAKLQKLADLYLLERHGGLV